MAVSHTRVMRSDSSTHQSRDHLFRHCPFHCLSVLCWWQVNGVRVWAKGSNMIPAGVLSTNVSLSTWRWLLQSAVGANQNMVSTVCEHLLLWKPVAEWIAGHMHVSV